MPSTAGPDLVDQLGLAAHPEGGWYRESWRAGPDVHPGSHDGPRALATAIYFLLLPGEASRWHVVASDELWLWHLGGPLTLELGGTGAVPAEPVAHRVGPDVGGGERPQALVPAGTWQRAAPAGTTGVLVTCVVAPGFDFRDFRLL